MKLSARNQDLNLFALRQMRATRRDLVLRWMLDGYSRRTGARAPASAT